MNKLITPNQIKELIEVKSGTPNIGIKTRKREFIYLRIVYYKLCREFCNDKLYPLEVIGKCVGKDHCAVLHGLKSFEDLNGQKTFKESIELYEFFQRKILRVQKECASFTDMDRQEMSAHYKIKLINLENESKETINSLREQVEKLKRIDVLDEISEMTDSDLNRFSYVVRNFILKTKESKWKKKLGIKNINNLEVISEEVN